MDLVQKHGVRLLPVDSENSAIFQSIVGEQSNPIEKIYLTASGGPLRGKSAEYMATVGCEEALRHPNRIVGAKMTIETAPVMTKGPGAIETKWRIDIHVRHIDESV